MVGGGTSAHPLGVAGLVFTRQDSDKLAGIESGATTDQTPAEIVAAINTALGGAGWQTPGAAATTTGQTQGQVDARVRHLVWDWAQASSSARLPIDKMPENGETIIRAYIAGGYRTYPSTAVQISGPVQTTSFTGVPSAGVSWGSFAPKGGGFRVAPAYFLIRFEKSSFAATPSVAALENLRIFPGGEEALARITDIGALSDDGSHWYAWARIEDAPSGPDFLTLYAHEPAQLDILPQDDSLTTRQIKGLGSAVEGEIVKVGADGAFTAERAGGLQEVYSGSFGITPPSLYANSGVGSFSFEGGGIDLDLIPRGILFAEFSLNLPARSSVSIGWNTVGVQRITANGQISLQEVAATAVYNGTTQLGEQLIRYPLYLGATHLGDAVIYVGRNATNQLAGHYRYEFASGHTTSGSLSASASGRVYLLSGGAVGNIVGTLGPGYVFDSVLPDASHYADDDLGIVASGANRGVYVKDSEVTHGAADTGWGGKTIDPYYNLTSDEITGVTPQRTVLHGNLSPFTLHGENVPTGGNITNLASGLAYIYFAYDSSPHANGEIGIAYTSARTYTGTFTLETHGGGQTHLIQLRRVNSTLWQVSGISPSEISALLGGQWTITEPGHSGSVVVHSWVLVADLSDPDELPTLSLNEGGLAGDVSLTSANGSFTTTVESPVMTAQTAGVYDIIFTPYLRSIGGPTEANWRSYTIAIDIYTDASNHSICAQETFGGGVVLDERRQVSCMARVPEGGKIRLEAAVQGSPATISSGVYGIIGGNPGRTLTTWVWVQKGK